MGTGRLFVISASSGAGKTSLVTQALKQLKKDHDISRVVTYTTREPRPNEVNGTDYHFISSEDFNKKNYEDFFLETSEMYDSSYGSPASINTELKRGKSLIIITDRSGARALAKEVPSSILIWITVPDFDTLKQRMKSRGTEDAKQTEKRLKLAQQEMDEEQKQPLFQYHLVNDEFDRALAELMLIITDEIGKDA